MSVVDEAQVRAVIEKHPEIKEQLECFLNLSDVEQVFCRCLSTIVETLKAEHHGKITVGQRNDICLAALNEFHFWGITQALYQMAESFLKKEAPFELVLLANIDQCQALYKEALDRAQLFVMEFLREERA